MPDFKAIGFGFPCTWITGLGKGTSILAVQPLQDVRYRGVDWR
jgi:hypothetical protein